MDKVLDSTFEANELWDFPHVLYKAIEHHY
jgi:hypothetical protein